MRLVLPSGRGLHYIRPKIETQVYVDKFGHARDREGLTYEGRLQAKKVVGRISIYGGKWVENGDQAFCRDILVNGMKLADKRGLDIVMHSHDELVAEVDKDSKFALDDLIECMVAPPDFAPDIILAAEGYETDRHYRKE